VLQPPGELVLAGQGRQVGVAERAGGGLVTRFVRSRHAAARLPATPITPSLPSGKAAEPASRRGAGKADDGGAVPPVAWHFALAGPEGGSRARTLLASAGLRDTTNQ